MGDVQSRTVELDELTPALQAAYRYWQSLFDHGIGPPWRAFDLSKLPPSIIPTTMVVDVHETMTDNRYRFWGSGLTAIHGREMTGKCPYDLEPADFGKHLLAGHTAFVKKASPEAVLYEIFGVQGFRHSHMVLRVPLSNDGKTVTQMLICADYTEEALEFFKERGLSFSQMFDSQD